MKKRFSTIVYIATFLLIDQITKYIFYNQKIWAGLFHLEPAFNTWISRSLPINMILIIALTLIITIIIIIWYKKKYIWKRATIFLIWWTIGNLIDRIFLWWVRDFIIMFKRFPIFNIADIFICTWAILIIIQELFTNKNKIS